MKLNRSVVALALVLALVLAVGTMYALAACGQCAGAATAPAKMGCGGQMSGGCGMKMGGGCGMQAQGACPKMARVIFRAKTRALQSGQVTLAAPPRGLMLAVTNLSHRGDPNASVSVYGMGAERNAGVKAMRVAPGRFKLMGDLQGLDELAVRVNRPGTSEVVYFAVPAQAASMGACKCGAACKCATGDRSACKCGSACMCAQAAAHKCGPGCKAAGATCPRMAGGCGGCGGK